MEDKKKKKKKGKKEEKIFWCWMIFQCKMMGCARDHGNVQSYGTHRHTRVHTTHPAAAAVGSAGRGGICNVTEVTPSSTPTIHNGGKATTHKLSQKQTNESWQWGRKGWMIGLTTKQIDKENQDTETQNTNKTRCQGVIQTHTHTHRQQSDGTVWVLDNTSGHVAVATWGTTAVKVSRKPHAAWPTVVVSVTVTTQNSPIKNSLPIKQPLSFQSWADNHSLYHELSIDTLQAVQQWPLWTMWVSEQWWLWTIWTGQYRPLWTEWSNMYPHVPSFTARAAKQTTVKWMINVQLESDQHRKLCVYVCVYVHACVCVCVCV